ncbi:uncharacterized protein LOC117175202 [Belonocnema kinseyi]|uniref:uncharacterized protein LOC117175202 n=1 Tax=Belonocnema kinseyi TaxID=2817044 RepID=UPI00143D5938|nr:uncharacterized protein LOC117175202 [Belonocnema kinseyi]
MKHLLGNAFLAFVVIINFGELNAPRIHRPHTRRFSYLDHWILVWDDADGHPARMRLEERNQEIPPEWHAQYEVEQYLEFREDIYFLVTTMKYNGVRKIARVDNPRMYNIAGYSNYPEEPHSSKEFAARQVDIYRRGNRLIRVRFSDRNVIPLQSDEARYQIEKDTTWFTNFRMTFYTLKFGYVMGVRLATNYE